jgi:ABC-type branched-subunit amino acid transport system substrate-binding protein
VIGGAVITYESILPTFGDEALGIVTPLMYSAALDTPANREFVTEYRRRFSKVPSYFTYPAVSQFWTYKPEDFLKQPLYTRDSPPCRGC